MKLRKLELTNFRAVDRSVIEFPGSGVLLIAGANNSGKSALLAALDVVAFGGIIPEAQHCGLTEPATLAATFALNEVERNTLMQGIQDGDLIDPEDFRRHGFHEV